MAQTARTDITAPAGPGTVFACQAPCMIPVKPGITRKLIVRFNSRVTERKFCPRSNINHLYFEPLRRGPLRFICRMVRSTERANQPFVSETRARRNIWPSLCGYFSYTHKNGQKKFYLIFGIFTNFTVIRDFRQVEYLRIILYIILV